MSLYFNYEPKQIHINGIAYWINVENNSMLLSSDNYQLIDLNNINLFCDRGE